MCHQIHEQGWLDGFKGFTVLSSYAKLNLTRIEFPMVFIPSVVVSRHRFCLAIFLAYYAS